MQLFGRKNPPPGANPSASTAKPPATEWNGGDAGASLPPPSTANQSPPAPPTAISVSSPQPSSTMAPYRSPNAAKGPEMNTTPNKPSMSPSMPGAGLRTEPRRVVDAPGSPLRRESAAAPSASLSSSDQQRRLIVGRDISLSGEITSCDILVVEGNVEAKLRDGRSIEIAETGLFKGSVEIDEADIGGRFEGDILVRGRLRVRSTGRINGSIKYGELEVEAGGRLVGDIQVVEGGLSASSAVTAPAADTAPAVTVSSPILGLGS